MARPGPKGLLKPLTVLGTAPKARLINLKLKSTENRKYIGNYKLILPKLEKDIKAWNWPKIFLQVIKHVINLLMNVINRVISL